MQKPAATADHTWSMAINETHMHMVACMRASIIRKTLTHAHTHTHTHRQRQRNTLKTPKHPKSIQNQSKHTPNTLRTRFNSGVLRFSSSVSASSLRRPGADLAGLLVQGLRV